MQGAEDGDTGFLCSLHLLFACSSSAGSSYACSSKKIVKKMQIKFSIMGPGPRLNVMVCFQQSNMISRNLARARAMVKVRVRPRVRVRIRATVRIRARFTV